jgi:DNA helicase-2/ATP-dependent DNA helicase PcrA
VFTDATLIAIGESLPETPAALTRIAGVGKAKADRYGAEVLALITGSDTAGSGSSRRPSRFHEPDEPDEFAGA